MMKSRYVLRVDRLERERLDKQHTLVKRAFGDKSYHALLETPRQILDVACGTGVWAIERAYEFPSAKIVGGDLDGLTLQSVKTRLQKKRLFPKNLTLREMDALQPFPFEDETFDFVFMRFASPFVPIPRWLWLLKELCRVTRRGGWVEVVDSETQQCQLPNGEQSPALQALIAAAKRMMARRDMYAGAAPQVGRLARAAGLRDMQEQWAVLGALADDQEQVKENIIRAFEGASPLLIKWQLLSQQGFDETMTQLRQDLAVGRALIPIVAVWGRRPLEEEEQASQTDQATEAPVERRQEGEPLERWHLTPAYVTRQEEPVSSPLS